MKPFNYQAPTSVGDAVRLLASGGEGARVLAGGTDLLVQMRDGRFYADLLVDVKRIPEMNLVAYDPSAGLTLGAAVPCYRLGEDPALQTAYPCLVEAASLIGSVAIRGRASVGGNLCNSAPSGDCIPALLVLQATCAIAGVGGSRTVPAEQFCTGPGRNVLERGEVLVSIHLPAPEPHSGAHYLRFIPRNEMDIAVVGAGACVVLSDDLQTISRARIALGAVAPTPLLVAEAGEFLAGRPPTEEVLAQAAALAQQAARPISDMRGSAAYRRHLVGVLVRRALRGAVERARANSGEVGHRGN